MGPSRRILVVDDEERVLLVLHDALIRLGSDYEIVPAQNGREALKEAKAKPFDLLITDLRLPHMGGVALTEAMKQLNPDLVVIWVTAYGCHEVQAQAERLGVYQCLDKPVEVGEIRRVAREALETI